MHRFVQATQLDGYRVQSVARIDLTFDPREDKDPQGEISRFWHELRRLFPGIRYFCWLELHRDGRIHYHAVWLNPPPRTQFDLHQDVARIWRNGRTRGRRMWPKRWSEESLAYVLSYAKKIGKKAYEQDYNRLDSNLRTFMSQRLGYDLAALDAHRDRLIVAYIPGTADSWRHVPEQLELRGELLHQVVTACEVVRATVKAKITPLLKRQPMTGLPGRTWREQRAFVVQAWLPR